MLFSFKGVTPNNGVTYPNPEAFAQAVKMAECHEKISCIFDVVNGYEVVKLESKSSRRFELQLNEAIFNWLFNYLIDGECNSLGIDASKVEESDETDGNSYRKHLMMHISDLKKANSIQVTPEFRERTSGKFSAIANFNFGTIYFYMDRDEEIKEWIENRQSYGK